MMMMKGMGISNYVLEISFFGKSPLWDTVASWDPEAVGN